MAMRPLGPGGMIPSSTSSHLKRQQQWRRAFVAFIGLLLVWLFGAAVFSLHLATDDSNGDHQKQHRLHEERFGRANGLGANHRIEERKHSKQRVNKDECKQYPKCADVRRLPTTIGGKCGFDVTNDTHYLPDPDLVECLKDNDQTIWQQDFRRYELRVLVLQNPERCDAPDSVLDDHSWHVVKFTSHGHGVNAFTMSTTVGNHWDRGIPVVASFSAYRFGSHQEICQETRKAAVNANKQEKPQAQRDWCLPNGKYELEYGRCRCFDGYMPSEDGSHCLSFENDKTFRERSKWESRYKTHHKHKVDENGDDYAMVGTEHWMSRLAPGEVFAMENYNDPAHWSYPEFARMFPTKKHQVSRLKLKHGFFWWMLQNLWLLHKEAPKRAEMERRALEVLGQNMECVAVHVRRGDSCDDPTARHRTCPKLDVYAAKVQMLKEKYFKDSSKRFVVYLASDDPTTIDEAKAIMATSNEEWVWQPIDRARYVNGKVVDNNPALFSDTAMDELYFDLWAMSMCKVGYVASFASSVAWNAYALAVGRYGYYVPFISIDWPWGHKILGGHHAKNNLFDSTVDASEVKDRMNLFD